MLQYITRTALEELIANGSVHDCAEGYGNYVVALTTARFGKGLAGEIYLEKWYESECYANRMARNFELDNLCPGWDSAWEVEVWCLLDDDLYEVDPVFDPDRPSGRVYLVLALDENDETVYGTYRHSLHTAVKKAQTAVRYAQDVDHATIYDFGNGRVVRVEEWSAWDNSFYAKLMGEIRDELEYAEAIQQLPNAGELVVI